jgi:hypothetical protein
VSKQAASGSSGSLLLVLAAGAATAGAFLPWAVVSLGPLQATLDGDSGFLEARVGLGFAAFAGLAALANLGARRTVLAALAALGFAGAFAAAAYAWTDLSGSNGGLVALSAGYGLWISLLGSLAGLLAGLLGLRSGSGGMAPMSPAYRRPPVHRSLDSALRPPPGTPATWLVDPTGQHLYRWFDGAVWTPWVSDGGEASWTGERA